MDKKKLVGVVLGAIAVLGTGIFIGTQVINDTFNKPKQETTNIVAPQKTEKSSSKENKKVEDTEPSSTTLSSSEEKEDVTLPTEPKNIHDNIDEIKGYISKLHNFDNATKEQYDDVVTALNAYGIQVDPNVQGPFGQFDDGGKDYQGVVLAGHSKTFDVNRVDNTYKIDVVTQSAMAQVIEEEGPDKSGRKVNVVLKEDESAGLTKGTSYDLVVDDSGMAGHLVRTNLENWW